VSEYQVRAVTGIPDVGPGDDLAALIATAAPWLADGDVLVVTSKIVSKAEGRLVDVPVDGPEREIVRDAVLASETARPVARRGPVRIVQTHHGLVMANAGIDASNVDVSQLVLLPKDPDASARSLRQALRERFGLDVAVIVTDTMGRAWRLGLTDVAIGAAGIDAIVDYRGTVDAHGNELNVTQMAVVDELASAGELVKRKSDRVPVAVVRGIAGRADGADGEGAAVLVRRADEDLFSLGTAEAMALGHRNGADVPDAEEFAPFSFDGPAEIGELPFPRVRPVAGLPANTAVALAISAPDDAPMTTARIGAEVQRLRVLLAADGFASAWLDVPVAALEGGEPVPAGRVPLGVLAIGRPRS
jgi:coenzyme F420-0:L-glutamate ligase/coenzyme F420-1:gamma-L-glutamate ligase